MLFAFARHARTPNNLFLFFGTFFLTRQNTLFRWPTRRKHAKTIRVAGHTANMCNSRAQIAAGTGPQQVENIFLFFVTVSFFFNHLPPPCNYHCNHNFLTTACSHTSTCHPPSTTCCLRPPFHHHQLPVFNCHCHPQPPAPYHPLPPTTTHHHLLLVGRWQGLLADATCRHGDVDDIPPCKWRVIRSSTSVLFGETSNFFDLISPKTSFSAKLLVGFLRNTSLHTFVF